MVNSIFLYDICDFYEEIAEEYYEKKFSTIKPQYELFVHTGVFVEIL